jgi:hypothetical protein
MLNFPFPFPIREPRGFLVVDMIVDGIKYNLPKRWLFFDMIRLEHSSCLPVSKQKLLLIKSKLNLNLYVETILYFFKRFLFMWILENRIIYKQIKN